MENFPLINRLPPYVFTMLDGKKAELAQQGIDFIDFGMGNPDLPSPEPIVQEMITCAQEIDVHGYAPSNGIPALRKAIASWYDCHYDVTLDPEMETIVTIGSKEGLAHLALATTSSQDLILVPDPCYPIHKYAFTIAGATVQSYDASDAKKVLKEIKNALKLCWPKPKFLVLNFPSNPTTQCLDLEVFAKIVQLAKKEKFWIIQDLAYADLVYDQDRAPSILQVPGAKEVAVETFSLSKSYNMAGWRIGFMCGNPQLIAALRHLKSYMDYGIYMPLQQAAVKALTGPQDCIESNKEIYRSRRDKLCASLANIGWDVAIPDATMFLWAEIPEAYRQLGSLKFSEALLEHAQVAVSPGCCFGDNSNSYVRFSLIQEDSAVEAACAAMSTMFKSHLGLDANEKKNVA